MLKKILLLTLFFCCMVSNLEAQNKTTLEELNTVWEQFYKAFSTLDAKPMAEIHSKKLIRISGGQTIIDYDAYIEQYNNRFANDRENKATSDISLRFFERIHNDETASERGIYQLIRNKGQANEQTYYGQFHVLFTKEEMGWKILMDYDSDENGTIGEEEFLKASAITDFDKFTK